MTESITWRLMLLTLWEPWYFMYLACTFLPTTVTNIIQRRNWEKFLSWAAFRDIWFANIWAFLGPMFAEGCSPVVGPLVMTKAKGVIFDIGPGAGDWVHLFKSSGLSNDDNQKEHTPSKGAIEKIYGFEPNLALHAGLRRKIKEAGLSDVYQVVGADVERLGSLDLGIEWESVDTIVTIQVMCSVSRPTALVKELYRFLKPGGTWIMWEHVRTHERGWIGWYQALVNVFWPFFFHGCSLTRSTDQIIKLGADWEKVNISMPKGQNRYMPVPGMLGYFTRRSARETVMHTN